MKTVDYTLLILWRSEMEEFDFVVKHWPVKSQTQFYTLSCYQWIQWRSSVL